jgi:hypothetical protein
MIINSQLGCGIRKRLIQVIGSILLCCATIWCGCRRQQDAAETGTYQRKIGPITETIILNADGSFSQEIIANGLKWNIQDKWSRKQSVIQLHKFYEMFDLDKNDYTTPPKLVYMKALLMEDGDLVAGEMDRKILKKISK